MQCLRGALADLGHPLFRANLSGCIYTANTLKVNSFWFVFGCCKSEAKTAGLLLMGKA